MCIGEQIYTDLLLTQVKPGETRTFVDNLKNLLIMSKGITTFYQFSYSKRLTKIGGFAKTKTG